MNTTEQFKHIILLHQPAMQRMAESILHSETESEDAVQDVLEMLWKQRKQLLSSSQTEAFCIVAVKNRCIDILRRRHPTQTIDEQMLSLPIDEPDNTEEKYQEALRMVNQLPELQRKVILLKYEDAKSTEEITKLLNISTSNLYTSLSRAINNLRNLLKNEE